MKTKKQILGKFGENLAINYLEQKGYSVIDKNVKTRYTELDIIFKYKGLVVFVEVKTRANEKYGLAVDALSHQKQKYFKKSLMFYCSRKEIDYNFVRADFVAIQLDKARKTAKINHYKDII